MKPPLHRPLSKPARLGLAAALLSSAVGGTAIVATRALIGSLDPLTIGAVRFGGGFVVLLGIAVRQRQRWPIGSDWPFVALLGCLFFGLFPVLFNAALVFTTAARGALALSTLPLLTMAAAAILGVEPLTTRKAIGVLVALGGVAAALATGLTLAPPGAWRGDLIMVAAASCMALYSVWSRPFITRSGPLSFAASGMGVGALCLLAASASAGGLTRLAALSGPQWIAVAYLAVVCGALIFYLWAFALSRTTPTLVAVSVTVNPVTAALLGSAMLDEPVSAAILAGLVGVLAGIGIAAQGG